MPTAAATIAAPPLVPESGGAQTLASDIRLAFILCNEARYRTLARLFGTSRDQANLLTWILVLMLVQGVGDWWRRMIMLMPSLGDEALAGASLRELLGGAAGLPAGDSSQLETLLTLVFVGGLVGPSVVRSARSVRDGAHWLDRGFRHRYGYLVDPGHWRRRHYEARELRRDIARESTQTH